MGEIVPPIIIDNHHPKEELTFFASASDIQSLEPWYVEEEHFTAYDSQGRLLKLRLDESETPLVTPTETVPTHEPALRAALAAFLANKGLLETEITAATTDTLLAEAVRRAR